MWKITRMQVMLSSIYSRISFCGGMNRCESIIYVVSCVWILVLPAIGYCVFLFYSSITFPVKVQKTKKDVTSCGTPACMYFGVDILLTTNTLYHRNKSANELE